MKKRSPMLPPVAHPKPGERGFALLLVFLLAASIALMLYQQVPRVAFESERDKEQLLIDRGEQYKRAIQEFYIAYKRYPVSIDELEHTNDKRYLRKRYVDPYTGKDEWRLIHTNGVMLTDSLNTKPPANPNDPNNPNNPNKDQVATNASPNGGTAATPPTGPPAFAGGLAGGTGGGSAPGGLPPITLSAGNGGVPGQPGAPASVNPAVLRRPSDRSLTAGQFPAAAPAAVQDPNNPAPPITVPDPNNPAQGVPPQGVAQNGQFLPGQLPGQAFPGQNQSGQFGGQPGNNFNQLSGNTQLSPTDFPPISLQALQQQQGTGGQNNGQLPGQPGAPAGNQVRIGQNGQFVPVTPPVGGQQPGAGAQGFPGSQPVTQSFPTQPFQGAQPVTQPFPGAQSTDPSLAAQGAGQGIAQGAGQGIGQGQGAGAGPGGTPNNAALGLINQLLTTPRQPPPGIVTGAGSTPSGGLGIAGIASKYEGASVKIYHDHQKFKEWEFIFDPNANAPQVPAPTNPLGNGTNPTGTTPGMSPAGQTSPFGTSPTTNSSTSGTSGTTPGTMPSIGP